MQLATATLALALLLQAPPGAVRVGGAETGRESRPFTAARFREHAAFLASDELRGRKAGSAGAAKAAEYIAARFGEARLVPVGDGQTYFQAFTLPDGSRCRNVLGVLPGAGELAEQHVIVSAHLDHLGTRAVAPGDVRDAIYNGADDNASGVAAILLIAEDLARERGRDGRRDAPRRAIVFAVFDAEELGLLGASYHAEHPARPLDRAAVVLNFDMVGRLARGRLSAADAETSADLARAIRDLAKTSGVPVETRLGGSDRGDHAVFLRRRIPSVHFHTGLHADYHDVSDELAGLDCEGGARVAALGADVVRFAAGHAEPFAYHPVATEFDTRSILDLVRRLGVIPALNAQNGRYPKVIVVLPGSLAQRKGLKPGDEITAINGVVLQRIDDALLAIAQIRLDQDLRITVRRGGESFDVRARPEEFAGLDGPAQKPLPDGRFEVTFRFIPPAGIEGVSLAVARGPSGAFETKRMDGPGTRGAYSIRLVLDPGEYHYHFQCRGGGAAGSHPDPDNRRRDDSGNRILRLGTPTPGGQAPR